MADSVKSTIRCLYTSGPESNVFIHQAEMFPDVQELLPHPYTDKNLELSKSNTSNSFE